MRRPQRVGPTLGWGVGGEGADVGQGWASLMHLVTSQRAERSFGTVFAMKNQKRIKSGTFLGWLAQAALGNVADGSF